MRVQAPGTGVYEIYHIAGLETYQLVSESLGRFNETMTLTPGSYLLLADCSHGVVIIRPGELTEISAHRVDFLTHSLPKKNDLFSVQCARYEPTHLRQVTKDQYTFYLIENEKEMLVGMKPIMVAFPPEEKASTLQLHLSSIQVEKNFEKEPLSYYVSLNENDSIVTQAQNLGSRQWLLPGKYRVSLGGGSLPVDLNFEEDISLKSGGLDLRISSHLDWERYESIQGEPPYLRLSGGQYFALGQSYSMLPGFFTLTMSDGTAPVSVEVKPEEMTSLPMRTVQVNGDCSPEEWGCLGSREVLLFRENEDYPFFSSHTDIPIPFWGHLGSVSVGLQSSLGIKSPLPLDVKDVSLFTGMVILEPQVQVRSGLLTDLVRVEAVKDPVGYSQDVSGDEVTRMPLLSGSYRLALYHSSSYPDGERQVSYIPFSLQAGKEVRCAFPFYVSEKKISFLQDKLEKEAYENIHQKITRKQMSPLYE